MIEIAWNTAADWAQSASDAFWAAVDVVLTFVSVLMLAIVLAGFASATAPLLLLALLCMMCG